MTLAQKEWCASFAHINTPEIVYDKMVEELAELIQSVQKYKRELLPAYRNEMISEIADVLIMLEQLKCTCSVTDTELNYELDAKVDRQRQRFNSLLLDKAGETNE